MTLTVHIPDEAVPALRAKASGVSLEAFAEQVLLKQIEDADSETADFDREKAQAAVARIRELRKGVRLDLQGMSLREFAHIGHRF
jgi:predicted secreted Zn-dependent protease